MKIDIQGFQGEAPKKSPRDLSATQAQIAMNASLGTDDLKSWRQFTTTQVLTAFSPPAQVKTIYKLNDVWLSFKEQVDIARGLIPGDTTFLTFLTSPALYAQPQYTNYALATTGAPPLPVVTKPLGMPAPTVAPTLAVGVDTTATTFSVNIIDAGDQLTTSWTTSPVQSGSNFQSDVSQSATIGNPTAPSYRLNFYNNNEDKPCYLYRNFGIASAAAVNMKADFYMTSAGGQYQGRFRVGNDINGAGLSGQVSFPLGTGAGAYLSVSTCSSWADPGTALVQVALPALTMATWYTIVMALVVNADGTVTMTVTLALAASPATIIQTVSHSATVTLGDLCGVTAAAADLGGAQQTYVDNIQVMASGSNGVVIVNAATAYLYTFQGANAWESAPGPVSATILRPDGVAVTVTTPTTSPYDAAFGIDTKVIYRAVSGASGTEFLLVAVIPLTQADFIDTLDDAQIDTPGTPLPSLDWDMPPPTLEGIIALPNDCMAGFFGNQLCLSAQGFPHAWPVKYRLTTDTPIVSIKNIDNTIVITTNNFVYTATGTDPSTYSMSAPGEAQACVSKRGTVFVDGFGVVFPSKTGFQVCSGSAGSVQNATAGIFEKEQWEALDPSSIIAAVYDGILFFWCDGTTPDSGFALDTKAGGFGLTRLANHVTAAYVEPITHGLYMVLDQNNEPVETLLPVASSAVAPDALMIYQFDAHATARIRFQWRGKLNIVDYDSVFHFAKVEAEDFANLALRVYADGSLLYAVRVTSAEPFRIPALQVFSTYELELVGTSRGRTAQLVQDVTEFS